MGRPDPSGTAFDTAVRLLARRAHSRRELVRKLSLRGFPQEDIDAALIRCDGYGYLNDADMARRLTDHLNATGHGPAYIRHYLRGKGLSTETDDCLDNRGDDFNEETSARQALEKKLAASRRNEDPIKRRQRLYRFLLSRGFSGSVALAVVDRCLREEEGCFSR